MVSRLSSEQEPMNMRKDWQEMRREVQEGEVNEKRRDEVSWGKRHK